MGFADYLRALRDGRTVSFDQHSPPADGGRPRTEAIVGGGGFVSERPGLRIALLTDVEEIGISEAWSEPGSPSPPSHLHRRHVESFYVLEGEMTFTAGGRELRAEAGSWVQVPPACRIRSPFPAAVGASSTSARPSCGFGVFLRGLNEARTDDELAAVRAAFDQIPA